MFIQFDPKTMHVQVLCGVLEKYEPSSEILAIQQRVMVLQEQMKKFRDEVLAPELNEINKLVEAENKKYIPVPDKT